MKRIALLLALALATTACGRKVALQPAAGQSLPVKPATAAAQPTPAALLTPSSQARPGRVDDAVSSSRAREEDPFDLPPTG